MKEILVPKGQRTRILHIWSSSMPGAVRFTASTQSGNPPTGIVETSIRRLVSLETTEYPLQAENNLTKGLFDSSYTLFVTPDEDTTITFQTRHFQAHQLFRVIGVVIVLGVLSALVPLIIRSI